MKKAKVWGVVTVHVYQIVEVEDNATTDEIIDKAINDFEGIEIYGANEDSIGISGDNNGLECNEEVEFAPNEEKDIEYIDD